MYNDIDTRTLKEGQYIIKTNSTVRKTAKYFGVSKSTVHKDVTSRLKILDYDLYEKVKSILKYNLNERHIRGGEATKIKYDKQQKHKKISE